MLYTRGQLLKHFFIDGYKTDDAVYFWNRRKDNTPAVLIPEDLNFLQYEMTHVELEEKNNTYNSGMTLKLVLQ